MAEQFETSREIGVALNGFRLEVAGQFSTIKWILGGVSALGVVVAGVVFNKVDALEEIAARNTAILERIEASVTRTASNTEEIKKTVQAQVALPVLPRPETFPGWTGAPLMTFETIEGLTPFVATRDGKVDTDAWLYFREGQ
jgi:hypothetical protein